MVQHRKDKRQHHEQGRQDGGGAGQQVCGAATGHEGAHALGAADPQPAALASLDQHHADQRKCDEQVDDQQDGGHQRVPGPSKTNVLLRSPSPSGGGGGLGGGVASSGGPSP